MGGKAEWARQRERAERQSKAALLGTSLVRLLLLLLLLLLGGWLAGRLQAALSHTGRDGGRGARRGSASAKCQRRRRWRWCTTDETCVVSNGARECSKEQESERRRRRRARKNRLRAIQARVHDGDGGAFAVHEGRFYRAAKRALSCGRTLLPISLTRALI